MSSMDTSPNTLTQQVDIDVTTRAALKGQKPVAIWLTGLSGAGKSTIANALEVALGGRRTAHLLARW